MEPYKPKICKKNKNIRLLVTSSDNRICDYCGEKIQKNKIILTVGYRFWVHINCVDEMVNLMKEFKKENAKELILDAL